MALTKPRIGQLNTSVSASSDPITVLNQGSTTANADVGFLFNRANGLVSNVALYWSESANSFVTSFTSNSGVTNSNISPSSYANLTIGSLLSINGNIYLNGVAGTNGQYITQTSNGTSWITTGGFDGGYVVNQSTFGSNLIAASATTSTSTTTGALVVVGGAGITGTLYVGANVTVTGNVLPSANVTYNLGSPSQRWKDLWLSGNTIDLAGAVIKTDPATGAVAIIPNPTEANPNPSGVVISPAGTVSTVTTTAGVPAVGSISTSSNVASVSSTSTFANANITSTTTSTSTTTGALIVAGGVGIAGTLYSYSLDTGAVTSSGTIIASTVNAGTIGNISANHVGTGTYLTSLNATNLSSGTVSSLLIPTLNQNTTGSAATLTTSRNINGTAFNGSADITVTADASTLTGTTLASGVTTSSLTSVGTLTSLAVGAVTSSGTIIASTVNAGTIGNISANHVGTGTYLTSLNATNLSSGTVASAQISGSYTGITGVGALAAGSITTGFTTIPVAQGGTGVTSSTGSGNNVLSTSPTLVTPVLGTPSSGTLTSCTGLPNAGLVNSSVTVTAGTGMSGGGAVSLGSSITLTNAGVTSAVAGTAISVSGATGAVTITNSGVTSAVAGTGVSVSGATGAVTFSIGQSVGTGVSPTFAGITLPSITHSGTSGTGDIGGTGAAFGTVWAKATSAQYADLAEKYSSDLDYPPGTVVVFGGEKEITISTTSYDTTVAGVISTNPGYSMNTLAEGLEVALTGRVPCRVIGPVRKGQIVVTSDIPGVAQAIDNSKFVPGCVIGKALTTINTNTIETIEVVVGRF